MELIQIYAGELLKMIYSKQQLVYYPLVVSAIFYKLSITLIPLDYFQTKLYQKYNRF
jgi:hypothetical protein